MAKWCNNELLDAMFDEIISTCTTQLMCSGQPTDRATALSSALATIAVTGSDFSKSNSFTSGRTLTVSGHSGVAVSGDGTIDHCALIDATRLLYITTVTPQAVLTGNEIKTPAWTITLEDPE
jgi:hypothetical protein